MTAVQRRSPNSRTHPESKEPLLQTLQRGDERRCRGHVLRGAIQQSCEAIQKLRMALSMCLRVLQKTHNILQILRDEREVASFESRDLTGIDGGRIFQVLQRDSKTFSHHLEMIPECFGLLF